MTPKERVIAAFSEEHTARLTSISTSQLRRWDSTGFYRPSFAEVNRRVSYSRIYSFKDILSLRVLNVLRNQYSVPLSHLREVSEKLSHLAEDRWTGTRLYVFNKRVIWQEPGTERPQEIVSTQYLIPMQLEDVISGTEHDIASLNTRDESKYGVIERTRFINHNAPVIAGTRISVDAIKRFADAGFTPDQILKEYPDLTKRDVEAALAYKNSRTAA